MTSEVIIEKCARCGKNHRKVTFYKFEGNPISADGEDFMYWGWCPTFLEPLILNRVDEDEEFTYSRKSEAETKEGKDCTLCRCSSECEDSKSCPDEAEQLPTD